MTDFKKYSENFLNLYTDETPEILLKFFDKNKLNLSVLDLGCGDGALLMFLYHKGYLKNAKRIVGVDLSLERLKRIRSQKILSIQLICSDACSVKQLDDNSFDYIFNTQVIEHVPDDKVLLVEIRRLLKKNGILYISSVVKRRYGWYVHRNNGRWVLDPTHVREYSSEKEFVSRVRSAGFKILESKITQYKFIPIEFFVRRIYFPIFKPQNINSFFLRHKILNKLRLIKIPVIGYYTIEVVAEK